MFREGKKSQLLYVSFWQDLLRYETRRAPEFLRSSLTPGPAEIRAAPITEVSVNQNNDLIFGRGRVRPSFWLCSPPTADQLSDRRWCQVLRIRTVSCESPHSRVQCALVIPYLELAQPLSASKTPTLVRARGKMEWK